MIVEIVDRRCWIAGYRCHHGLTGVALAAAAALIPNPVGPVLFGVGVALVIDDWPDFPWTPTRKEPT